MKITMIQCPKCHGKKYQQDKRKRYESCSFCEGFGQIYPKDLDRLSQREAILEDFSWWDRLAYRWLNSKNWDLEIRTEDSYSRRLVKKMIVFMFLGLFLLGIWKVVDISLWMIEYFSSLLLFPKQISLILVMVLVSGVLALLSEWKSLE